LRKPRPWEINQYVLALCRPVGYTAPPTRDQADRGDAVNRPRAADDFATIRARMEDLRREQEPAQAPPRNVPRDPPQPSTRYGYGSQQGINTEPGRVRQPGVYAS